MRPPSPEPIVGGLGWPYLAMVHHRVGRLAGECDCPDGKPGSFCEHSVAVGLSYLYAEDAPGG